MLKKLIKILTRFTLFLIASGTLILFVSRIITALYGTSKIYTEDAVQPSRVAIVFGAGLWRDGTPTPVLRDRVTTATNLYFSGKVEKLLLSGDNRFANYNEPRAMYNFASSLGVPDSALVLDYAGRSTYDTCYRAHHIFGLNNAILVTQNFHLPRALYTCRVLGIKGVGVSADRRTYSLSSRIYWNIRELPATVNAMWEVYIVRPIPVLGEPEFIYPSLEVQ